MKLAADDMFAEEAEIYLDGHRVEGCLLADEEAGEVLVRQTSASGVIEEALHGKVEIHFPTPQLRQLAESLQTG